jgi:predicted transcriptional regulator
MKTVRLTDKTCEFLNILAKQNVTLPDVFVDYLKWTRWTKDEIKKFLDEINEATSHALGK